jgi:hypothetical protein
MLSSSKTTVDYDAVIATTDEEIAEAEGAIARLRELLTRKRVERARAAGGARRDALHALRERIEPQIGDVGAQLVELAQAAHDALTALATAVQERKRAPVRMAR